MGGRSSAACTLSPAPGASQTPDRADLLPLEQKRLRRLSPFPLIVLLPGGPRCPLFIQPPVGVHLLAPQPPARVHRLGKCVKPAGSQ